MPSVWILTKGCYSDERVVGAFSTQEKAEAVIAWQKERDTKFHSSDEFNEPVEVELDATVAPDYLDYFFIEIRISSGEITRVYEEARSWPPEEDHGALTLYNYKPDVLAMRVRARDCDHASKIAVEKLQEYRAKKALEGK